MADRAESFEGKLMAAWPAASWRDVNVIVAVSGGADSVALLRALVNIKLAAGGSGQLHVAHINHGLRQEAKADAGWVAELCHRLKLPLTVSEGDIATEAERQGDGVEAAARTVRYELLVSAAHEVGARFVATGHTADDQVETVLHRVLRGSGLAGLAGIPAVRQLSPSVAVVRPLLGTSRADVERYLKRLRQDYLTDESNKNRRFSRNRLRHELLPLLRADYNADVDTAILRLAGQAAGAQQFIAAIAWEQCGGAFLVSSEAIEIAVNPLQNQPRILVREACKQAWTNAGCPLQAMGFDEWQTLASLVYDGKPATLNLPGGFRASLRDGRIKIVPSA